MIPFIAAEGLISFISLTKLVNGEGGKTPLLLDEAIVNSMSLISAILDIESIMFWLSSSDE